MFDIEERVKKLIGNNNQLLKYTPNKNLSIQEQSIMFFDKIWGQKKEKENIYRALISEEQINVLLIGSPATSKTLFMDIIAENCNNILYFQASNTSGVGLIDELYNNQKVEIVIIDEYSRLRPTDMGALLGLLNNGVVMKSVHGKKYNFKMKCKVFATSNSLAKLTKPQRSRFQEYHFKEYSDEEFVEVVKFCLNEKIKPHIAEIIAKVFIAHDIKDARKAISISRSINPDKDTEEDIIRVISNYIESHTQEDLDYD